MAEFILEHAKALYVRFCAIYGDKFYKLYHNDDFKRIWYEEWQAGLAGIDVNLIKDVLNHCKINVEWPPSIAEFRRICEQSSGFPSLEDALHSAVRREFDHPIMKLAYDKVGSWDMKNDKQDVLRPKFKAAYEEALNAFRINPIQAWGLLEEFKAQPLTLEPPPKIPTEEECLGFKARLKLYQEKSKAEKLAMGERSHPEWPKDKVTIHSKHYDEKLFNERKRYLINLDEVIAGTLCQDDWYDRICFLREIEALRHLERVGYTGKVVEPEKVAPRRSNGPRKGYQVWGQD